MKLFLLGFSYLIGAGEIILGIYFIKTNSRSEVRKVMSFLSFMAGMWVLVSTLIAYHPETPVIVIESKSIFVFGIFLMTSLLHFCIIYPYQLFYFDRLHKLLMYLPAAIFSVIALITRSIEAGIIASRTEPGQVIPGPVYFIYNSYLLILYVISIVILIRRLKSVDGIHKRIIRHTLLAVILGGLPAVFIDLILPLFLINFFNYLFGVIFTGFWLGIILTVLFRRN